MKITTDIFSNVDTPQNIQSKLNKRLSLKEKAEAHDELVEYIQALEDKVREQDIELKKNRDSIKSADALREIMGIAAGVVGYPGPRG